MPPSMKDRLQDILEAIIEIEDIIRGISFDQFASDRESGSSLNGFSRLSAKRRERSRMK